jgi:serine/threonine-protein kinase RsbW
MATVEVAFTPLPAHVRTARLIATAVARRSGVSEALLDEVRLAVGEACSRAVEAHRQQRPSEPIRVTLGETAGRFEIEVVHVGRVPGAGGDDAPSSGSAGGVPLSAGLSLAVISGLADEVHISETAAGTSLRMSWPLTGPLPAPPGR